MRVELRFLVGCVAVCVAVSLLGAAAPKKGVLTLEPGEYIADGGAGTLVIQRTAAGVLTFSIETIGANAHMCSLEGELRDGKGTLEGLEENEPCVVMITPTGDGMVVEGSGNGACRAYCGARAWFEMTYRRPSPACVAKAVSATRAKFKKLYDRKQFAEARATLEPVLKECTLSLDWITTGWIRNDLAITLHKLGDRAGCRAMLEPLAEDAALTDAEVREAYPPTDAEMFLPIVRATRTNLRLCGR